MKLKEAMHYYGAGYMLAEAQQAKTRYNVQEFTYHIECLIRERYPRERSIDLVESILFNLFKFPRLDDIILHMLELNEKLYNQKEHIIIDNSYLNSPGKTDFIRDQSSSNSIFLKLRKIYEQSPVCSYIISEEEEEKTYMIFNRGDDFAEKQLELETELLVYYIFSSLAMPNVMGMMLRIVNEYKYKYWQAFNKDLLTGAFTAVRDMLTSDDSMEDLYRPVLSYTSPGDKADLVELFDTEYDNIPDLENMGAPMPDIEPLIKAKIEDRYEEKKEDGDAMITYRSTINNPLIEP